MPAISREQRNATWTAWRRSNKDKLNAKNKKWRDADPKWYKFICKRSAARRAGVEFSLEFDQMDWPDICPVLGIPLIYESGHGSNNDNYASIDRIDNALGYIPGNVAVISLRANKLKRDASLEELQLLVSWFMKVQRLSRKGVGPKARSA